MATNIYQGSGSYTAKKKKGSPFKWIFFLSLVGALGYSAYYAYQQRDRFLFYFQKDKYVKLKEKLKVAEDFLAKPGKIENSPEVAEVEELLTNLAIDHPTDQMVFFFKGRLYFKLFHKQLSENKALYKEIFFSDFLNRYQFPPELNRTYWHKALISLRKSLALGLSENHRTQAIEALSLLYLWGGKAYYPSGAKLLAQGSKAKSLHLFNIILGKSEPNWQLLEKSFSAALVKFWQALYFLRIGNEPRGFSHLKDLASSEDENSDKLLQNNARYLLGHIMKSQKKWKSQLSNWQQIDLDEFLQRHGWFLSEYNYLLRYLGKKKEASAFLRKYEKVVNKVES